MLKLDRTLITLLFAGYVGKLLILGSNLSDAPIALILAAVYFLFHYKLQMDEIVQLRQELSDHKELVEESKKSIDDIKSALASAKIAQGFRSVK